MQGRFRSLSDWLVREILRYPFPLLFEGAWTERELSAARDRHNHVSPAH
jgi:hypothetical protein